MHESEDGGVTTARFLVNVDSNHEVVLRNVYGQTGFYIVGYWTGIDFTETWIDLNVVKADESTWVDRDVFTSSSIPKGSVCLASLVNRAAGYEYNIGVRTDGSSLTRYVSIHEAEGGGVNAVSMFVKSSVADGIIEIWCEDEATDCSVIIQGYFGSDMDFTELMTIDAVVGVAVWADWDLTALLDQDGRVCDFLGLNTNTEGEFLIGVRKNGSGLNRVIVEHEAEGGGNTGFGMNAESDTDGIVELWDPSFRVYYITGYFKWTTGGNNPPTNDVCDSDPNFDVDIYGWVKQTVTDIDGVADLKTVEIQITTSDSKIFTLRWTQSTNVFSEESDTSGICTLDVSGSQRINIDSDTDRIEFKFMISVYAQYGNCDIQATTTDDQEASDQDNYPNDFTINLYTEITVNDGTHAWTGLSPGSTDILLTSPEDFDVDVTVSSNAIFNLQAKGDGNLISGSDNIPVGNVKIHADTLESAISLTTSYQDIPGLTNQAIGGDLSKSFKAWITVPSPKEDGNYVYVAYVQVIES